MLAFLLLTAATLNPPTNVRAVPYTPVLTGSAFKGSTMKLTWDDNGNAGVQACRAVKAASCLSAYVLWEEATGRRWVMSMRETSFPIPKEIGSGQHVLTLAVAGFDDSGNGIESKRVAVTVTVP